MRCRGGGCNAESRDCERYGRQRSHTGERHIHITWRKSRDHLKAPLVLLRAVQLVPSICAATDGLSELAFPSSSTRKMRLRLILGCALVAACATVASGITEIELERVTEPAVIIASHVYRGYVVDEAFEGAVQAHLMPASLLLFGLDCTPTSTPSEICQMLTADQAVLLNLDPAPRPIPLTQTTSPAVFAAGLIQSAYPHLVREFPSAVSLWSDLDRGATLLLAYVPASHAASKATFLHVAVQFQVLKLKLALIPDLSVVRGVAPAVPTHAGEQVLVWYTAVVGGTRGWKLVPFPTGLNEEFTVFAHKCTFPAHVHYRGKESHSVFKGSGLPQAFVLLDSAHQHSTLPLVKRLAAELLGDYAIMSINIETHPEMLEYFHGANLDSLPDFFVRPTPGEIITLSPDIPRNLHSLASALRNIARDSSSPASPEEGGDASMELQSMTVEEFSWFVVEHQQQPAVAVLCVEGHTECFQLRESIQDLAVSLPRNAADVQVVLVQVEEGVASLDPLSRRGVVLTSLPMLLVHNGREWLQFESDLSFTGIVRFVQETLKWSEATVTSILSNHARILDSLGADQSEESLYPPQLLEDDELGIFVHDHKITAKLFRDFDRDPDQLRACIAAQPQSVVTFYQPWSVRSRAFLPHLPEIQALAEGGGARVSVCAVNCQDHPDLCQLYNVTTYPSVLLHRGEGQWAEHCGVLGAQQVLEALVDRKAPTVEEVTPYSLPRLLLRGKPLAILLLPSDGSALLSALPPVPPLTTLAWLNHSRYQHVLGKLGQVYGVQLPSLVVMDTSENQTSIRRCKPRDAGPLDIAAINACLAEVGGKWLSWEQPVELPSAQWLPKMDPLPFPNQNRKETVEPISEDNQMPAPSHAHKHTEL